LRATLVENLEMAIGMYFQKKITLKTFPYQKDFEEWLSVGERGAICPTLSYLPHTSSESKHGLLGM